MGQLKIVNEMKKEIICYLKKDIILLILQKSSNTLYNYNNLQKKNYIERERERVGREREKEREREKTERKKE